MTGVKVSARCAQFLYWVTTHDHHYAGWYPQHAPPQRSKFLELRGHGCKKRVAASTAREAMPFMQPGSVPNRMYELTAQGLTIVAGYRPRA